MHTLETMQMGLETTHVSYMFELNNGHTLRVNVRPMVLLNSMCISIEVVALKMATNSKL